MSFIARLQRAREILAQQGRLSTRALERELEIGGDELDEIIEELVDVQQVAQREGRVLIWAGTPTAQASDVAIERETRTSIPTHHADQAETRKVVTVVFADLIGSTSLHERLDAESTRRLMDRYYRALHAAVEAHGGAVVKLMGDGVMAAFGVPRVAEDDAIRAVRAGVAMQQAFRELARQAFAAIGDIGLRVGINTGEVVVSADNTDVVGDPVNVAARLQQEAHDGEVVIGESTRRLVAALVTLAPLGSVALKGRAEAMKAYRVESLDRPAGATAAAFVGRDEELARITAVYEATIATPRVRLAVLLGSPGLGKSRLIDEFARGVGDATTVLTAQCDAAGGATFAPLAEALREFLHADDGISSAALRAALQAVVPGADAERTRIIDGITALLAGSPASTEETFFVVRRLLAALASTKPVVLVIDDLHWAEPLLLDLVEHLVQWGSGVPLLVLVGARPELRDTRSSLATPGGLVSEVVTLAGLDAGAAMRLAANVIGATDLPAVVAAKVLATSEGNPLFVAELVRMLVQEGALRQEGDRWITGTGLAALEMPPTIHALLAARIERLRPEERGVLERAAVVGRHFSRSAVAALLPHEVADLDVRLEALRRSELIESDTGWFLGEPVLRFHHVLIRDAAYRRLLKGTRAELHGRFADWIESRAPEAAEHDETLGWHLEQAHQLLGELGPIDAQGQAIGERAARHLAAAGRRALARDDLPVAAGLVGRALERLDAADPGRADLALDWCEALLALGDVGAAAQAIDELGRFALRRAQGERNSGADRLRAWHTCFAGQLTALTEPQSLHATTAAVAAAAEELAAFGDAAGEAKAHFVYALALARLGKVGDCEAALDRALAAARRAGDRRRANTVLAIAPLAALWGPSPVTRASGRCLDVVRVLRITQGAPAVEAVALSCQAVLEALRGRTAAARRMIASARKMVEELGITPRLLEADVFGGLIDLLEGDAAAAERTLRAAYDGLRDLGLGIDAARAAALLARALLAGRRVDEAETLSHESEALAGDDLKAAIAWRGVRAEALAQRGEHATAVEIASKAVEIAATTDALLDHADARLALAAALRAAGRSAEADAEERRAIELWEAKGATLLAERARRPAARAAGDEPVRPETTDPVRPGIATERPSESPVANAASRAMHEFARFWHARDWDGVRATYHSTHRMDDRRKLMRLVVSGDDFFANERMLFEGTASQWDGELLATRGERLALFRLRFTAKVDDSGPMEVEMLDLVEVDATGRRVALVVLDPDGLDAAYVELEARYEAGEGAAHGVVPRAIRRALDSIDRRDWAAVAAACASDFLVSDHRLLGWGTTLRDTAEFVRSQQALAELSPDVRYRRDHVRTSRRAHLCQVAQVGTRDGGRFENPFVFVGVWDESGRARRFDLYDVDQLEQAQARFEEIGAGEAPDQLCIPPNVATRAGDRLWAARAAGDWDTFRGLCAPECVFDDRRRGLLTTGDRDLFLAIVRQGAPPTPLTRTLLATAGDRLALERHLWTRTEEVVLFEVEMLSLTEVNAAGHLVAFVGFDADDRTAASVEALERFAAGEAAAIGGQAPLVAATRAFLRRDWEGMRQALAPEFTFVDHRTLGLGTLDGDQWVESLRTLADLSSDLAFEVSRMLAWNRHGLVAVCRNSGTVPDGGPFESVYVAVSLSASDRIQLYEVFGVTDAGRAVARFEELSAARGA